MIHDRGNIKWVSLMLPEHVKMLKRMWNESEKILKPVLDEQQMDQFDEQLCEALEFHSSLLFKVFKNGFIIEVEGDIRSCDRTLKTLHIEDENKQRHIINIKAPSR